MDNQPIIRFYFESGIKKYKKFRESPWYKAIFETLNEKNTSFREGIIALDITTFIKKNYPRLFQEVDGKDERLGKKVGSCLSQLRKWGIFRTSDLENKGLRQKLFKLEDRYGDFLVSNIKRIFLNQGS